MRRTKSIKELKRKSESVILPGFIDENLNENTVKACGFEFPGAGNSRIDLIIQAVKNRAIAHVFELAVKKYLEAEKIIGIKTALGIMLKISDSRNETGANEVFCFLRDWFKYKHKDDLHPLFPLMLEELGYKTDNERILKFWHEFFGENLKLLFKHESLLIRHIVSSGFSNEFEERSESCKAIRSSLEAKCERIICNDN